MGDVLIAGLGVPLAAGSFASRRHLPGASISIPLVTVWLLGEPRRHSSIDYGIRDGGGGELQRGFGPFLATRLARARWGYDDDLRDPLRGPTVAGWRSRHFALLSCCREGSPPSTEAIELAGNASGDIQIQDVAGDAGRVTAAETLEAAAARPSGSGELRAGPPRGNAKARGPFPKCCSRGGHVRARSGRRGRSVALLPRLDVCCGRCCGIRGHPVHAPHRAVNKLSDSMQEFSGGSAAHERVSAVSPCALWRGQTTLSGTLAVP